MSLKDDLLRNRRVFERLTEPEGGAEVASAPPRQTAVSAEASVEAYAANPIRSFAYETQETARPISHPQQDAPQKVERFSLEFGSRVSRETGMSLSPPALEDISFPELRAEAAPTAADPLEDLYHRLESEARRASQLLVEEEF